MIRKSKDRKHEKRETWQNDKQRSSSSCYTNLSRW